MYRFYNIDICTEKHAKYNLHKCVEIKVKGLMVINN